MGMALGTGPDRETAGKLTNAFTAAQLAKLRRHHEKAGHVFGPNRRLPRLAYRLEAFPLGVPRKWMGLLELLEAGTAGLVAAGVPTRIKAALQLAVDTPSVTQVEFHYDNSRSGMYDVTITTTPPTYHLTLLCPGDWAGADGTFPPAPHHDEAPPDDLGPGGPAIP